MIIIQIHRTRYDMLAQKRLVTITLDIMCYDDLDIEDINWKELLKLEPGEEVHCKIQDHDIDWQCASLNIGTVLLFSISNRY